MKLHTFLNYGGNCEQAFRFYEKHLGGEITMMKTHGPQPNAKGVSPEQKDAILHARVSIGETLPCHSPAIMGPYQFDPNNKENKFPCKQSRHIYGLTKRPKGQPSSTHPFSRIQTSKARQRFATLLRARWTSSPFTF